jgi:hypothetical protein
MKDRAESVRPIPCRVAAGWRSGRTPAEPYPPAGVYIILSGGRPANPDSRSPQAIMLPAATKR